MTVLQGCPDTYHSQDPPTPVELVLEQMKLKSQKTVSMKHDRTEMESYCRSNLKGRRLNNAYCILERYLALYDPPEDCRVWLDRAE